MTRSPWRFSKAWANLVWLAALSVLAACTPQQGVYRDLSAPIAATTRFEPHRLAGDWWVRSEFSEMPVAARQVSYDLLGGSGFAIGPKGGPLTRHDLTEGARWKASGAQPEIWLLWVDADYRTAAIGTPDGTIGMILDRSATGGSDRITAARDVLDWFGYDMTKLQEAQL